MHYKTLQGSCYVLVFIDDYSRFFFLKVKMKFFTIFKFLSSNLKHKLEHGLNAYLLTKREYLSQMSLNNFVKNTVYIGSLLDPMHPNKMAF